MDDNELKTLIQSAASGDEGAFDELSKKYAGMLKKSSASFAGMTQLSEEDLFQEALVAFFKAVKTYDPDDKRATFGAYSRRCVRNSLISVWRKEQSAKRREKKIRERAVDSTISHFDADPSSDAGARIFSLLSPFESKVLGQYFLDLSYDEIAERLSCSKKSVDNALCRIRKKLKNR